MKVAPAFGALALLVVTHCSKERRGEPAPASSASVTETAPSPADSGRRARTSEQVRSVYPLEAGPTDALVHELCSALHELPEERRASCCDQGPGVVVTRECERMLTSAVSSRAVSLDQGEVDRCKAAVERAHEGCDWVGPFPPATPEECEGLVHGSVDAGAPCRSSLECTKGLRCHGAGPTSGGICGKAHAEGQSCGSAVDTLAVFVKQQATLESAHRECDGYCDHQRCASLAALGGACRTAAQCQEGGCAAGKCVPHVLGKPGGACPTGECAGDARCIAGKCMERRREGACKSDFECLGGCIKSDGGQGVCGKRCNAR